MRTTIKDIAKKTGLSVSTVSLALNGKSSRLAEKTVQAVLDAAQELHYRPNQMAVGLITQKTKTIGLIVPDICNPIFSRIAKGAESQCQESGYNLILCNTNDNPNKDIDYMNILLDRGVDGIIFVMSATPTGTKAEECIHLVEQAQTPVVLVDRAVNEFPAPSVLVDHEMGAFLATKHLLELGHRRIGCISGPMSLQTSKQRFFGYIRALQEYQVNFDPELVAEGDYHIQGGYQLSGELLDKGVTAIFASNDLMACGVFKQATERSLKVPRDLSIVGFDDTDFSEIMVVPLTTVNQPVFEMGKTSVAKLIEMIDSGGMTQENVIFKPSLIVRESTRALSGGGGL